MKLISSTTSPAGQAVDLDEYYDLDGTKVRVRVHHDLSYLSQSWAKAYRLSDSGWNLLASYHHYEWAKQKAPTESVIWSPLTQGIYDAREYLLELVPELLG